MELKVEMKNVDQLIRERGLQLYGPVQKDIDQNCIKFMDPYTPRINGALIKSATLGTVIGSGKIEQAAPQTRYLYYGKLMVSSITGSSYAKEGESKVLTDKDLEYSKAENPNAGPLWFERMKEDRKEDILRSAQKIANGGTE